LFINYFTILFYFDHRAGDFAVVYLAIEDAVYLMDEDRSGAIWSFCLRVGKSA